MQRDLAVRSSTQTMACSPQLPSNAIVIVELAVNDDMDALVLVGDRLIPRFEVDDSQTAMAPAYAAVSAHPKPVTIWPAVVHRPRSTQKELFGHRRTGREYRNETAHPPIF